MRLRADSWVGALWIMVGKDDYFRVVFLGNKQVCFVMVSYNIVSSVNILGEPFSTLLFPWLSSALLPAHSFLLIWTLFFELFSKTNSFWVLGKGTCVSAYWFRAITPHQKSELPNQPCFPECGEEHLGKFGAWKIPMSTVEKKKKWYRL